MPTPAREAKRFRTLSWIIGLATVGLMFDGYDLVVYGTVVSTFLRDPTQIGPVDPALAGALGSYAPLGVLVGALVAVSIGDFLGRRKMMLGAYAWFSLAMAATAVTNTASTFGLFRFLTGLGVGVLLTTTPALVSEYAPKGKKNRCNAITYSGVPLGSLAAAALAILLLGHVGWRGMFLIGALPLVTLLPLAIWKMPESVAWLVSRGRIEEAREIADATGVELPEASHEPAPRDRRHWLPRPLRRLPRSGGADRPDERHGYHMAFGFDELVAHAAYSRDLVPGTVIGSGTVSNASFRQIGSACIAERRGIELLDDGGAKTPFMSYGDRVEMECRAADGTPLFGAIRQAVTRP